MGKIKLFENWTWNRKLPEPFNNTDIEQRSKIHFSKYCTTSVKTATLHSSTLTAILTMMDLSLNALSDSKGAMGMQGDYLDIVEYPSKQDELQAVVFNKKTGKFIAGCYDDINQMPKPYSLKDGEKSGTALIFALIKTAMEDEEFSTEYEALLDEKKIGFPDLEKAAKSAYILCDNLYRRIENAKDLGENGIQIVIPSTGNIAPFTSINLNKGTYSPDFVLFGKFSVLVPNKNKGSKVKTAPKHSDFICKYKLNERLLNSSEELLIPKLPNWYVIPEEVVKICKHANLTTKSNRPMRNFLLRGKSGTGKTEGAKAIATGLGLPYVHLTCSANTEVFDLLGQMMPVVKNDNSFKVDYPTFDDIRMDTATAYYKLTGEYSEDITEDEVYKKLIEVISLNASNKENNNENSQKFSYVESPLIKAMKYGYLIEIQEPTVISNPGVLVGLNSLLDTCSSIVLPTGERIERHPDTVVVITTNVDYEGCRALNQSVLSRMDLIIDMEEPDTDILIERVSGITGCKEKSKMEIMAKIINLIQERCHMNMIDDGCCGVREFISWVQSYMICGDIMEAAQYTILPSVSADSENREDILTTCIEPILNP